MHASDRGRPLKNNLELNVIIKSCSIRSALPLQMQPVSKKCKKTAPPPLIQRRRGGIFVSIAGVRVRRACAFYVSLFPVRDKVLNYCRPRHRCEDELRRTLRLIALFPLPPSVFRPFHLFFPSEEMVEARRQQNTDDPLSSSSLFRRS